MFFLKIILVYTFTNESMTQTFINESMKHLQVCIFVTAFFSSVVLGICEKAKRTKIKVGRKNTII